MDRTRIYCEIDFYVHFCENQPLVSQLEIDDSWRNLFFLLLKSQSEIYLNISLNEFIQQKDKIPFSDYLIENLYPVNLLKFKSIDFPEFPNSDNIEEYIYNDKKFSYSLILSNQSIEYCDGIENDYGLIVLNKENFKKRCNLLFTPFIQPIEKKSSIIKDWGFLRKILHPCNTLIIFDNYINKEKEINLFALLEIVLPTCLKIPFHITISTLKEDKGIKTNHKVFEEKTNKFIQSIRPNLDFRLCIMAHDSIQIHDRNLFTNYIWLNAPAGFDLFAKNKKNEVATQHTTSIFGYFPTNFQISTQISRTLLIKTFSTVFNNTVNTQYVKDYWGNKENRLFEN